MKVTVNGKTYNVFDYEQTTYLRGRFTAEEASDFIGNFMTADVIEYTIERGEETIECAYYMDYILVDNNDGFIVEIGTREKTQEEVLRDEVKELREELDSLTGWVTYATGGYGHGTVVNNECEVSGRIVDITKTKTPPKNAEKRVFIENYRTDYPTQYKGDVTIPLTTATLCQGIRPGFWDGDIFIEVGDIGAQMIFGVESDGETTRTLDFDAITVQYKGV